MSYAPFELKPTDYRMLQGHLRFALYTQEFHCGTVEETLNAMLEHYPYLCALVSNLEEKDLANFDDFYRPYFKKALEYECVADLRLKRLVRGANRFFSFCVA